MYPVKQLIALLLSILKIATPFAVDLFTDGGDRLMYEWSPTMEFTDSHYVEIEKTPGEDFRILNLSDIQIYDSEIYSEDGIGPDCLALVTQLIEEQKPDLITISGDSFCSTLATLELIDLIESYDIPWAPVMGNHEGGNFGEWPFWTAWHLSRADNSLFEFGPKDMGYGNYVINVTENGDTIHSLYMMDTHNQNIKQSEIKEYDHLWDNQIEWYEWAVGGNEALAGHSVQSTVIVHIPIYEYLPAWRSVAHGKKTKDSPLGALNPACSSTAFGHCGEYGGLPSSSNGFFDKVKELGSTKDIIAGHDHYNDYSVVYEGVRLTYALHTGFGGYYRDDKMGATLYTVKSDGSTDVNHVYYTFADGSWTAK